MKKTAVDLLREKLFKEWGIGYSSNVHEEFKEIERQQIIEAFDNGYDKCASTYEKPYLTAEDCGSNYYQSKYGQ